MAKCREPTLKHDQWPNLIRKVSTQLVDDEPLSPAGG
jgi:hypothetical protein